MTEKVKSRISENTLVPRAPHTRTPKTRAHGYGSVGLSTPVVMGSKSRAVGGASAMSWRSIAFILLAVAIFTTFVAKHQMHQDLHMNFLEVGPGFGGNREGRGKATHFVAPLLFMLTWHAHSHRTST